MVKDREFEVMNARISGFSRVINVLIYHHLSRSFTAQIMFRLCRVDCESDDM
ncbi:hypothetical protein COCC4DRAFT_32097 [Bipolaris maydis ATCC 48331]|uniref:Uncharacterized protein n=2 Tax=Cochliobolus heterostrophus TaxID=5016 RepID=M2TPV8_COCH5|nr:uncharacterized protein COCC4DRAFT_32097 [Bipolaris maydis ATCC 48331]EMD88599.1 hypothetical protein COCHEDRAFT_1022930 [Bipolaris maydis C5]ENI05684.1 hypothetical protein COCC4DRAFT_32097 [Bipolaris maydis ATCC 48331]